MWAFCAPSLLPRVLSRGATSHTDCRSRTPFVILAKKSASNGAQPKRPRSKSNGAQPKRPRSKSNASSGFSADTNESSTQNQPSQPVQRELKSDERLKSVDSNGISLEHRLKEEIKHPLRKPKQTLFATLSFSAFLGCLIAISRFISHADSGQQLSINLLINITAVTTFGYLTWRQIQFGRRSLNSIAGRPQLRDLPIKAPSTSSGSSLPSWLRSSKRMSSLIQQSNVIVLVGRRAQLEAYLYRCKDVSDVIPLSLVLYSTDTNSSDGQYPIEPDALAERDNDGDADWKAWLAGVIPSKRNMVLLRINRTDQATKPSTAYLSESGDAKSLSLPSELSRSKPQ